MIYNKDEPINAVVKPSLKEGMLPVLIYLHGDKFIQIFDVENA
jgi:hypothetical protein